jgi:transketolase
MPDNLDIKCVNTIRTLSIDAIDKANSGHPGAALGDASLQYVVWDRFLRHNPGNPSWQGRDRFVLSAGHASMLLYSTLHLTGYDLSLDDLKNFRQLDSKTPGHPEYGHTAGVEVTTGPLGQGFAHGVGMALAESWMADKFNRPGHQIIDSYIYAMVSDGDLQEGLSYEAASFAGNLGLGKLIYLYMDNDIQIEGNTDLTENEDVAARFRSQGWHVIGPVEGNDIEGLDAAIKAGQAETEKPTLIICETVIGFGSPLANDSNCHGAPLGAENTAITKKNLGMPAESFHVMPEVAAHMGKATERGAKAEADWNDKFAAYNKAFPELAAQLTSYWNNEMPESLDSDLAKLLADMPEGKATRVYNGKVLNELAKNIPLVGGSADLGPSIKTVIEGSASIQKGDFSGRNIHFGVREHSMGSIVNGMRLFGGPVSYGSTFLIFSDYMRASIRLAALMQIPSIFVYSHDSIGVGEDGPTHQPIEQVMHLRSMPGVTVIRPCGASETVAAWKHAVADAEGPTVLVFTRQGIPSLNRHLGVKADVEKGAYTLWQAKEGTPDILLMASGSEVFLAYEAGKKLAEKGHNARVITMPSWELFDKQSAEYKESVIPDAVRKRLSVEAGVTLGWQKYVGIDGETVGIDHFGASGPGGDLFNKFGFTVENVCDKSLALLG